MQSGQRRLSRVACRQLAVSRGIIKQTVACADCPPARYCTAVPPAAARPAGQRQAGGQGGAAGGFGRARRAAVAGAGGAALTAPRSADGERPPSAPAVPLPALQPPAVLAGLVWGLQHAGRFQGAAGGCGFSRKRPPPLLPLARRSTARCWPTPRIPPARSNCGRPTTRLGSCWLGMLPAWRLLPREHAAALLSILPGCCDHP